MYPVETRGDGSINPMLTILNVFCVLCVLYGGVFLYKAFQTVLDHIQKDIWDSSRKVIVDLLHTPHTQRREALLDMSFWYALEPEIAEDVRHEIFAHF
jgi:hypothetical protein